MVLRLIVLESEGFNSFLFHHFGFHSDNKGTDFNYVVYFEVLIQKSPKSKKDISKIKDYDFKNQLFGSHNLGFLEKQYKSMTN